MTSQSRKGSSKETQCLSNKTIQNLQSQTPYQSDNVLEIPTAWAIPRKCQPGTSPNLALGIQWTIFPELTLHRSSMNICHQRSPLYWGWNHRRNSSYWTIPSPLMSTLLANGRLSSPPWQLVSGAFHPFLQLIPTTKNFGRRIIFVPDFGELSQAHWSPNHQEKKQQDSGNGRRLSCLWMKTSFSIIKARESGDMPDQMC